MESVRVQKKRRNKDRRHRRSLKQRLDHQKDVLLDESHKAHAERDILMTTAANLKKYGSEFCLSHVHTRTQYVFICTTVTEHCINVPSSLLPLQRMCVAQGRISVCEAELRAQKPLLCLHPDQLATHHCLPTFATFLSLI